MNRSLKQGDIVAIIGPNEDWATAVRRYAGGLGEITRVDPRWYEHRFHVQVGLLENLPLDRNEFTLVGTL